MGFLNFPSIKEYGKKVGDAIAVITAGIILMEATDLDGEAKKKTLMDNLNKLESDFKIDIPDKVTSFLIDMLVALGKSMGWITSGSTTPSTKK